MPPQLTIASVRMPPGLPVICLLSVSRTGHHQGAWPRKVLPKYFVLFLYDTLVSIEVQVRVIWRSKLRDTYVQYIYICVRVPLCVCCPSANELNV